MFQRKKYALVLAGGGAKGAYQIGAWKALIELKIEFEAIIGTSVGAVNGALIAQREYLKALEIWENISIDKIIEIPEGLVQDRKFQINKMNIAYLKQLRNEFVEHGGLNTEPFKKLIKSFLNEEKIRKTGIDFGIVTYQLSGMKPYELFLEDIPGGNLHDYLLASATLPGFKATIIRGKQFIDGGVYDNIPFTVAKERGYKKIIVIDVSGLGVNKRPDIAGTETIYIKNSIDMGSILDFSKDFIHNYMQLGYLDTLKVFEKVKGIHYFYNLDKKIIEKLEKLIYSETVFKEYSRFLGKKEIIFSREFIHATIQENLPSDMQNYIYTSVSLTECAALTLSIERIYFYKFDEFLNAIWKKYKESGDQILRSKQMDFWGFFDKLMGKNEYDSIAPAQIFFVILKYYFDTSN